MPPYLPLQGPPAGWVPQCSLRNAAAFDILTDKNSTDLSVSGKPPWAGVATALAAAGGANRRRGADLRGLACAAGHLICQWPAMEWVHTRCVGGAQQGLH